MHEHFNIEWVLAFQQALRSHVEATLPELAARWPLLRGLSFEAYSLGPYAVLVLHHIPEAVTPSGPSAAGPLPSTAGADVPSSPETVPGVAQRIHEAFKLPDHDAVVLVPQTPGVGTAAEQWDEWSSADQEAWNSQVKQAYLAALYNLISSPSLDVPVDGDPVLPIANRVYHRHPVFPEPALDARLWRYMNLAKFLSLVQASALWFSRVDLLVDPYEGSWGTGNAARAVELYGSATANALYGQQGAATAEQLRRQTYVNCWYMHDDESAAMWSEYAWDGIAVRSTFRHLVESLHGHEPIYAGAVSYLDFSTQWVPDSTTFSRFMHKRRSFEHEREVRALVQQLDAEAFVETAPGLTIGVDLAVLIEEIVVAPTAPRWYASVVADAAAKYGVVAEVRHSSMLDPPPQRGLAGTTSPWTSPTVGE